MRLSGCAPFTSTGAYREKAVPTIHNRRGLGLLCYPDGEIEAFETFEAALGRLNELVMTECSLAMLLEAYGS